MIIQAIEAIAATAIILAIMITTNTAKAHAGVFDIVGPIVVESEVDGLFWIVRGSEVVDSEEEEGNA